MWAGEPFEKSQILILMDFCIHSSQTGGGERDFDEPE
jgi:hypothetical protein